MFNMPEKIPPLQHEVSQIKDGDNYALWRIHRLTPSEFQLLPIDQQLSYLITCACLAPSTHNTQPWAFSITPEDRSIQIYLNKGEYYLDKGEIIDQRRVLPESDVAGRQSCISDGAAIANILVAGKYLGFAPTLSITDINPDYVKPQKEPDDISPRYHYIPIATVSFEENGGGKSADLALYEAIFTRTVNRGRYDSNRTIQTSTLKAVKEIGKSLGITTHLFGRDNLLFRAPFAEAQKRADSTVVRNRKFMKELANWLLPNDTNRGDGMPGDTFGLPADAAQRFHTRLTYENSLEPDDEAGFTEAGKVGIESSPVVGLITVKPSQPEQWIKAGITLGKIALLLESKGINMAIHAGIAEVPLGRALLQATGFVKDTPLILFRVGYAIGTKPHSPRLPLEEIIIS